MNRVTEAEMRTVVGGAKYIYCKYCGLQICKSTSALSWLYKTCHTSATGHNSWVTK